MSGLCEICGRDSFRVWRAALSAVATQFGHSSDVPPGDGRGWIGQETAR